MGEEATPIPGAGSLPSKFGSFAVLRPLASGGMGELYLAATTDAALPEPVAVKRLPPHLCWDPEFVRMFLDEVRIAAALDHPNIVRLLDYGVSDAGHYFAMEYLHGRDLRRLMASDLRGDPGELAFIVGVALEVAAALDYAHEFAGPDGTAVEVVHRDVSPANIFVGYAGEVKLLDFGIARIGAETRKTRAGTIKGKVGYMSPEQCRGDGVDRRTDVFSLGIVLYELSVLKRAFTADNDFAVMNRIVDGTFVRPSVARPKYPTDLEAIVMRAMKTDPDERYATAADFGDALRDLAEARGLDVSRQARAAFMQQRHGLPSLPSLEPTIATVPEVQPQPRRGTAVAATIGVVAGLGIAAGVYWVTASEEPPPAEVEEPPVRVQALPPVEPAPPIAKVEASPKPPQPEVELESSAGTNRSRSRKGKNRNKSKNKSRRQPVESATERRKDIRPPPR